MRGLSRIGNDGSFWHVMNRAVQRLPIFAGEGDAPAFLKLLRTFTDRSGLRLAAFCVMSNHYHALVRGPGEALTRCFHEVDRLWAVEFNQRRASRGHVFQGPFLSFRQPTAGWIVRTSLYIHLNPVPKLARRPEDHPWSSCAAYLDGAKAVDGLDPGLVLAMLDADRRKAVEGYRELLRVRLALKASAKEVPEEDALRGAAAAELAASAGGLVGALTVTEPEARRLAAWFGRRVLGLPVAALAAALGFGAGPGLSTQLTRMKARAQREPGYKALVARAEEILGGPPLT